MSVLGNKKSTWQKQTAVVISESPNMHMLLRELLRAHGWGVGEATPHAKEAIEIVRSGGANMIVIDDSVKAPALLHIRYLMTEPIALGTPMLAFLLQAHEGEESAMIKMGTSEVVPKPLTPARFLPSFVRLLRTWEREPFQSLRRAIYLYVQGEETRAMMVMARLMQANEVQNLCAQAIALHLRRSGKLKEAEKVLLTSLKRSPRELGTIMSLADLYMHAAMPKLAYKLLLGARSSFNHSIAMMPDLIQAALMLGQIDDAIESLHVLVKRGDVDDKTLSFLGRLMFAEGRETEAERLLSAHGAPFKKLQTSWAAADEANTAPTATTAVAS